MKNKGICCTIISLFLLIGILCACQATDHSQNDFGIDENGSEVTAESGEDTEDNAIPTILIDSKGFAENNQILSFAKYLHEGYDVKLEVLPDSYAERNAELSRIRTEIMAGGGPDAFVLPADEPGVYLNDGNSREVLFTNVEKAMRTGIFLPMDDLLAQSEHLYMEDHYEVIMDAGKTEMGQVVLPLAFSCSVYFVNESFVQDPEKEYSTWDDILNCPDENLTSFIMSRKYDWFDGFYTQMADYDAVELLVSPEEISHDLLKLDGIPMQADVSEMAFAFEQAFSEGAMQTAPLDDLYVLPVPNKEDGLTATITAYAAINRNTEYAQEVFQFIELLYDDVIQNGQGAERDGHHYYQDNRPSLVVGCVNGISTGKKAYPEQQTELIEKMVSRVNCVRFASDLDSVIIESCDAMIFGDTEEEFLETTEDVCAEMEMILAE